MSVFVPASAKELYLKMLDWSDLRGVISCDDKAEGMTWIVADNLRLEISIGGFEGMVQVFDSARPKMLPLSHWHPDAEDIYDQMLAINEGRFRFAYINTFFGKQIVYMGEGSGKKRRLFRRIHYLGEAASDRCCSR